MTSIGDSVSSAGTEVLNRARGTQAVFSFLSWTRSLFPTTYLRLAAAVAVVVVVAMAMATAAVAEIAIQYCIEKILKVYNDQSTEVLKRGPHLSGGVAPREEEKSNGEVWPGEPGYGTCADLVLSSAAPKAGWRAADVSASAAQGLTIAARSRGGAAWDNSHPIRCL